MPKSTKTDSWIVLFVIGLDPTLSIHIRSFKVLFSSDSIHGKERELVERLKNLDFLLRNRNLQEEKEKRDN